MQAKKNTIHFVSDENLPTYVKSNHELFSIFFIENEFFTEKVKRGVRGYEPNGRTVQPTQLILISN